MALLSFVANEYAEGRSKVEDLLMLRDSSLEKYGLTPIGYTVKKVKEKAESKAVEATPVKQKAVEATPVKQKEVQAKAAKAAKAQDATPPGSPVKPKETPPAAITLKSFGILAPSFSW